MNTNQANKSAAESAITRLAWLEYIQAGLTLHIDRRLLAEIGKSLPDGEWGVGAELATHYRRGLERFGQPDADPAQFEFFLTLPGGGTATVYFANINRRVYAAAEPMFPH